LSLVVPEAGLEPAQP